MAWLKTGYAHLLNNCTGQYTPSATELDMIGGGFGGFLEKNIEKMYKTHDRKPVVIQDVKLKELIDGYNRNEISLYEVSDHLAKGVFNTKHKNHSEDITTMFVLDVQLYSQDYLVALEVKRDSKYEVEVDKGCNRIILNPMIVANATAKKAMLFLINLSDLSASMYGASEDTYADALKLKIELSIREVAAYSREVLYNSLIRMDDRKVTRRDIQSDEKIEQVNKFEDELLKHINSGWIRFAKLIGEVTDESYIQRDFIKRLKAYNVPTVVKVLSDAKFATDKIEKVIKEKRVRLKNGIEVIVPADVKELDPIVLCEINGELVEVVEDVEM